LLQGKRRLRLWFQVQSSFFTRLAHIVFGILTALVAVVSPVLSVLNTIVFIIYELNEEWHLEDASYKDILEFAIGLSIGEVIILCLSLKCALIGVYLHISIV
jgi:hypothetical protein